MGKAYCARANSNIRVSLMKSTLAACHEPEGSYNRLPKVRYVFEHKAQYILAHAPCTCTVVFWHIRDMLLKIFRRVQFVIIIPNPPPPYTPCFVWNQNLWHITLPSSVSCSNVWANLRCSDYSPLGEQSLWSGTVRVPHVLPVKDTFAWKGSMEYTWVFSTNINTSYYKICERTPLITAEPHTKTLQMLEWKGIPTE